VLCLTAADEFTGPTDHTSSASLALVSLVLARAVIWLES